MKPIFSLLPMLLLVNSNFSLAEEDTKNLRLKCNHADIKKSVTFFLGKGTQSPTKSSPKEVTIKGKRIPIMAASENRETLSGKPVLTSADIEFIELYTSENSQRCDVDGKCVNLQVLGFNFTHEVKKKMREVTKVNKGRILLIKSGQEIISSPTIRGEFDNAVLTLGEETESPRALLQSMCSKRL